MNAEPQEKDVVIRALGDQPGTQLDRTDLVFGTVEPRPVRPEGRASRIIIGAAGLDVFNGEPKINEGYYDLPNTFLLPHLGSAAIEARNQMGFEALDNIDAAFAGQKMPFALN